MTKSIVLAVLLAAGTTLGGCYKSEFEAEKTKNAELETKIKQAESDAAQARAELTQIKQRMANFEPLIRAASSGLKLATYVNGVREGTDEVMLNSQGELVRHGMRTRDTSQIRFENGRVADQSITILSGTTKKPYITGTVKGSAPDGDWIWYNSEGKPANKEVWKDGKLLELYSAGAAGKDGQPTWKKLANSERDDWFKRKSAIFMNFPELRRELGTAPAAPTTPAAPKTGAPTGTTPPKPGTGGAAPKRP